MKARPLIRTFVEGCRRGFSRWWPGDVYDQDGLRTLHNHDFTKDPSFCKAYERGCRAAKDYRWHWRVHIGLWAASNAGRIGGDFVECGVNRGFLSSAIMEYLDWDSLGWAFYLLDTFQGLDLAQCSDEELKGGAARKNQTRLRSGAYVQGVDSVRTNFSQWKNVRIIPGSIPETLGQVDSRRVAYLHLDMNCSPPEVAAMEYFWDRLLPGAFVLLDDYGFRDHASQKHAMDAFARQKQVTIASLPTGQGLLLKPHPPAESGGD